MSPADVTQLISALGFPIVACLGFAYYIYEDKKAERQENKEREERYLTTIANFSNVLDKVNENLATNNKRLEYIEEKIGVEK